MPRLSLGVLLVLLPPTPHSVALPQWPALSENRLNGFFPAQLHPVFGETATNEVEERLMR